jgi:c-di-GMP-binding flagellar brake protein YcgR
MKEFDFLLTNSPKPSTVQILTNLEERKSNLKQILIDRERLEVAVVGNKIYQASSLFLKFVKKNNLIYLMLDSFVPKSAGGAFLSSKKAVLSYKIDNVACGFNVRLVHYLKNDDLFVVSFPDEIYRLQRRMFYRVQTTVSSRIFLVCTEKNNIKFPVYDVSEGGISFFANAEHGFVEDEEYRVNIFMDNGAVISTIMTIKNIIQKVSHKLYSQRYCCEFSNIDKRSREIIAKYVYTRQMEEIQKRKRG